MLAAIVELANLKGVFYKATLKTKSNPTRLTGDSVQRFELAEGVERPFPLGLVFLVALLVHAPLLLMKLPLNSYDTNFHFRVSLLAPLVRS